MSQAGREMVEKKHSLNFMLDCLEDIYQRYLGTPNG
jgi:hypothetical protein